MTKKFLINIEKISLKDIVHSFGDVVEIDDEYYSQFKDAIDKHIEFNHIVEVKGKKLDEAQEQIMNHATEKKLDDAQIEADADAYIDGLKAIGNI